MPFPDGSRDPKRKTGSNASLKIHPGSKLKLFSFSSSVKDFGAWTLFRSKKGPGSEAKLRKSKEPVFVATVEKPKARKRNMPGGLFRPWMSDRG